MSPVRAPEFWHHPGPNRGIEDLSIIKNGFAIFDKQTEGLGSVAMTNEEHNIPLLDMRQIFKTSRNTHQGIEDVSVIKWGLGSH